MTQLRAPSTFAAAMTRVAGVLEYAVAAKLVGRRVRTLQYWSQPNCRTTPTIAQALLLDEAYAEAGGEGAPFAEAYAVQLGLVVERREACRRQLAAELADAARESGEAQADAIHVLACNTASDHVITRALVSVEEARAALSRVAARISSFLQVGAGPASGSTGASST